MNTVNPALKSAVMDKTIVIKYGGNAMTDESVKQNMIARIADLYHAGANVVVVHGAGPQINTMLDTLGIESKFIGGYRYSCPATVNAVDMVLGGTVNQDLVVALNAVGCTAVGLTGKDASQFTITPKTTPDGADLGQVGNVVSVDTALMNTLLRAGYCVLVAPPSAHDGVNYNINADTVAGAVAGALQADYFMALTNVAGILDNKGQVVQSMTAQNIQDFMDKGIINGGMVPKALALLDALNAGTQNIVVADGTKPQCMIDVILQGTGGTLIKRS